ncbi:MAG: helix-hairpin-helix domain-containing protein [Bacteroidia bacterium]|nr:helix-hairpin-helix domain-containing protein [Bacteroidia bacterium]
MRTNRFLKDYFSFSRNEKNGILVLLALIIVLMIFPYIYKRFHKNENLSFVRFSIKADSSLSEYTGNNKSGFKNGKGNRNDSLFPFDPNHLQAQDWQSFGLTEKQTAVILNYLDKGGRFHEPEDLKKIYGFPEKLYDKMESYIEIKDHKDKKTAYKTQKPRSPEYFSFDPNTASDQDLLNLGLSEKQTAVIRKYLSKGGRFYKKEDFKNIYSIGDELYQKLEPYISIEANCTDKKPVKPDPAGPVDINLADTTALMQIRGIGKAMAMKIINYRDRLGGFTHLEQLKEITGITDDNFGSIIHWLILDRVNVKTININFAGARELSRHPYLNYLQAKAIVTWRIKNGSYMKVSVLLEKNILDMETYNKIKDFLVTE